MIEWSETHRQIREMFRRFVEAEIVPHIDAYEHEGRPPYDVLRKMMKTFGAGEMALAEFRRELERERARRERGEAAAERGPRTSFSQEAADRAALRAIPIVELARHSPGMITALGVSVGLTAGAIQRRGTIAQQERFVPPLLTMEKIGAWAITEPGSGSDAFGAMKSTARRDGDGYVLNGQKTFITNGPYADTIVFICKLDDGVTPPEQRKVLSFVLDGETPGLVRSKPLRKMGLHASPTGELFLDGVRVGRDRLLGESEDAEARGDAKVTFGAERTGVVAMALGIVERCLELCTDYARTRVQFGRPIGEFQLVQLKLARMQVARMNIQNLLFRQIELAGWGRSMDLAEASACKLYCAQAAMEVCLEAVQLFGGNGYMAEYRVEQLCRDAKVLQIYGGTDEIQVSQIARALLWPEGRAS
ncbi:MAG: acyl-CoA dehydrogenase family protein [Myxococcota bacterium]|nr:acyl-CoA dehydrogenase family protein [Myxococcota bacterium]MDW8361467.1 acyl-CoA dehydrogenase family protein [Myxococcales bacterium]